MREGWQAKRKEDGPWEATRWHHDTVEGPFSFDSLEAAEAWGRTHANLHAVSVDRFVVTVTEGPNEEGVVVADYSDRAFDNEVAAFLVCADCGMKMTHLTLEWE